jgi:Fic family protein
MYQNVQVTTMDELIRFKRSGEHRQAVKGNISYYTFIPNSLSEDLEVEVDAELANLMSVANRLLGQLQGMSGFLPNAAAIEHILLCKEALLSCQIDGINEFLYHFLDASGKNRSKAQSIRDYVSVMKYGLDKTCASTYRNTLLCQMHGKLIHPSGDSFSGQFRKEQIFLGNKTFIADTKQYNPAAPSDISSTMRALEKFIQRDDDLDVTIKMALAHYQFETIHPFMTGNGRIGRILSYLILLNMKVLTRPIFCLSQYLLLNKVEYIDRMEHLRKVQDYGQWIKFFIKSIIYAASDSLERINNWLQVREVNLERIEAYGKTVKSLTAAFNAIELHPIIDVNTLAEKTGVSYNTGAAMIKTLMDWDIVSVSSGMERYREYANADFLNCFINDIEK